MEDEDIRVAVYESFRVSGRAPDPAAMAERFAVSRADVEAALRRLANARHLALAPDGSIVMAHPFSAVPLGFSVMGRNTLWCGGCAWDSFALAHLLPEEGEVLVATRCPACDRPHAWSVGAEDPPDWRLTSGWSADTCGGNPRQRTSTCGASGSPEGSGGCPSRKVPY